MRTAKSIMELRKQIHDQLRTQHPEWIEPSGESPKCDEYEARLMRMLDSLVRKELAHTTTLRNDSVLEIRSRRFLRWWKMHRRAA